MNPLAYQAPSDGPDAAHPTAGRWRNRILMALIGVSLALIVRAGVNVGMDRYLSPRYWSYAIPSYFSEVTYHGPRYTYFSELARHFGAISPFSDVAKLQALLWDAAAGRVAVAGPPHFFPADEKGTVDFVKPAFAVFGIRVESLFYMYSALLAISLITFVVRFRRDSEALLVGLVGVVALYVAVRTFPVTKELYSVTNPRAIGSLSVIPLLHLSLATLRRDRFTPVAFAQLVFQAGLLVFVVSMRTAEAWQIFALIGVAAIVAARRTTPSRWVAIVLPVATTLTVLSVYAIYQSYAFPPEYFERNLRTKIVWHNVLIGFALHPGIADWYDLRVNDQSVLALIEKKVKQDPSLASADIFWAPGDIPDGMVKNFREYDRLCRDTALAIVAAHPMQTLKLFLWYKPRLLVRSFEYVAGFDQRPLSYYLLEDQSVSLLTHQERATNGAFFNPLSPIPLLLVIAACAAAGALAVRRVFDATTIAALAVIVCFSLLPAVITYPLIHVIAGTYWASALLFYALAIRFGSELALLLRSRTS